MTESPYDTAFARLAVKVGPFRAGKWLAKPNPAFGGKSPAAYLRDGGQLVPLLVAIDAFKPKEDTMQTARQAENRTVASTGIAGAVATLIMFLVPMFRELPVEQAVPITAAITTVAGYLGRYMPRPRGALGMLVAALLLSGCAGGKGAAVLDGGPDTTFMIDAQCRAATSAFRVMTVMRRTGRLDEQAVADITAAGTVINGICSRFERPTGMEYVAAVQGALLQIQAAKASARPN